MRWIDVAGAPGVGKSAILDDLCPRKVALDGLPLPKEWLPLIEYTNEIAASVIAPGEFRDLAAATFQKIATVSRLPDVGVYVQTGLAQVGLEIGWRIESADAVAGYYQRMPVSLGVVFLFADVATVQERNRLRQRNFAERVPAMDCARKIGQRVLMSRGVPVLARDTTEPIKVTRERLQAFERMLA